MWKTNHNQPKIKDLRKPNGREFTVQKNAKNVPKHGFGRNGQTRDGVGDLALTMVFAEGTFQTLFASFILFIRMNKMDNTNCIIEVFCSLNLELTSGAKHSTIIISNFMYRWVVTYHDDRTGKGSI